MERVYSRRAFVQRVAILGGVSSFGGCARLVRPQRVPRIGFLTGNLPPLVNAFTGELRRLGYVNGRNVVLESRLQRPNSTDLVEHAAELARMELDLVVAGALPHALEVRKLNPRMPMVIATCPGMVSNGFAASLEHPGGIYTGIEELPPGVTAKRLELLKEAAPALSRVALLSTTPGRGGHETQLADAERAASRLAVTVRPYRATTPRELDEALDALVRDGMEGLLNFQGGLSVGNRQRIVDFAATHRRPAIYQSEFFVEAGGLMAWAPDQEEQYREAARYVDRILRGARPGDLPVQYAGRYALILNTRAAAAMGMTLPPTLVAQAARVLQ
jgi:putative tryptophan/tyrosine transport system substrate-binding protein